MFVANGGLSANRKCRVSFTRDVYYVPSLCMLQGAHSFARRDLLLSIQADIQKRWADERIFEVNAPAEGPPLFYYWLNPAYSSFQFFLGVPILSPSSDLLAGCWAGEECSGKFFGNFPYPYMNGLLHLGHAFSLSKVSLISNQVFCTAQQSSSM